MRYNQSMRSLKRGIEESGFEEAACRQGLRVFSHCVCLAWRAAEEEEYLNVDDDPIWPDRWGRWDSTPPPYQLLSFCEFCSLHKRFLLSRPPQVHRWISIMSSRSQSNLAPPPHKHTYTLIPSLSHTGCVCVCVIATQVFT